MIREVILAVPRRLYTVVGWGISHASGLRPSFEQLTGIELDAVDESITHFGEWFEEVYPKDDE